MNTLYFKYAIEIDRTRSISQAAKNLYLAQPNLSKNIRDLESQLGYPVFERSSTGVRPTKRGQEFLDSARRIMAEMEKIQQRKPAKGLTLKVSLPRCSYLCAGFVDFMTDLDISGGMDISLQETNSLQAIDNVVHGRCDIAVVRYPVEYETYFTDAMDGYGLTRELIWETDYVVLLSERHPLAGNDVLDLEELRQGVEILYGDSYVPYLSYHTIFEKNRIKADRTIRVFDRANQFELLDRIPNSYLWVSPMPPDIMKRYGLVQRRCPVPEHRFKDQLIYRPSHTFTDLEQQLVVKLLETKAMISLFQQ